MIGKFLSSLTNAVVTGIVITVLLVWLYASSGGTFDHDFGAFFVRWLHVLSGVMWIGLLWYFNFVQIPNMPSIPNEQKPAISKVIAPAALFWFRWGAMATIITGLLLAWMNGYLLNTLMLGRLEAGAHLFLGIGMWFGIIMFLNVWLVIWPSQKVALGIVGDSPPEVKAASAARAAMFSRINTVLSIPMLFSMVAAQNIY